MEAFNWLRRTKDESCDDADDGFLFFSSVDTPVAAAAPAAAVLFDGGDVDDDTSSELFLNFIMVCDDLVVVAAGTPTGSLTCNTDGKQSQINDEWLLVASFDGWASKERHFFL
jgi:hypothetical protein